MSKAKLLGLGAITLVVCICGIFSNVNAGIQAGYPVITRSGNTTGYVTFTGALTANNCAKWDASGNLVDNGATCGGSGSSVTLTTVSFSATPTFTRSSQIQEWQITLTGNVTSSTVSGATSADIFIFNICQDATGNRTFAWPTGFSQAVTISSTASVCTKQTFYWDGTNAIATTPGVTTDTALVITGATSAAPATPASGYGTCYLDSTTKKWSCKDDAGTVSNTVVNSSAVSNQFLTGIASGAVTRAQPAFTDISGTAAVAQGGTGLTSGTSGGVLAFTASGTLASSGALTANLPVIGGGAGVAPTVGTRSGNTTAYVTTTGTQTSGDCVKIDANGNHVANGSACGGSGGTIIPNTQGSGWFAPFGIPAITGAGSVDAAGWIHWYQFTSPGTMNINRVALEVTTAAASAKARVGIYSGGSCTSATKLDETSDIDVSTTGKKYVSFGSTISLAAGTYWIARANSSGTPQYRTFYASEGTALAFSESSYERIVYTASSWSTGALPSNCTGASQDAASAVPILILLP